MRDKKPNFATSRRDFLRAGAAALACAGVNGIASLFPHSTRAQGRPFLMVTLGDSVMWGEGLPEALVFNSNNPGMKFRNIVHGWLLGHLGGRGVRQFNRSQTGAQIIVGGPTDYAPGFSGDIPSSYPSIGMQVQLAARDVSNAGFSPDMVDLVLLDGGINDVNIREILLPTNSTGKIQQMADQICTHRMSELLMGARLPDDLRPPDPLGDPSSSVMGTFKNAGIVLTGYFQIASEHSDVIGLETFLSALGVPGAAYAASQIGGGAVGLVAGAALGPLAKDQMVANSLRWKTATDAGFWRIVTTANQRDQARRPGGPPRVAFASPAFGPENAFAAGPASFLFTVSDIPVSGGIAGPYGGYALVEAEGVAGKNEPTNALLDAQWKRARACAAANRASLGCVDACMGHPNPLGAQAYAAVILTEIESTLAPFLATRGLVENPACKTIRAQEATANGTIQQAQNAFAEMGNEQKDCQAGTGIGDGGRAYKPKQCGALENEAEKKKLNASMEQAEAKLGPIRQQKLQAGCWY